MPRARRRGVGQVADGPGAVRHTAIVRAEVGAAWPRSLPVKCEHNRARPDKMSRHHVMSWTVHARMTDGQVYRVGARGRGRGGRAMRAAAPRPRRLSVPRNDCSTSVRLGPRSSSSPMCCAITVAAPREGRVHVAPARRVAVDETLVDQPVQDRVHGVVTGRRPRTARPPARWPAGPRPTAPRSPRPPARRAPAGPPGAPAHRPQPPVRAADGVSTGTYALPPAAAPTRDGQLLRPTPGHRRRVARPTTWPAARAPGWRRNSAPDP